MRTPLPALRRHLHKLSRRLPTPARTLTLARLTIPLCLVAGAVTEPLLRWLLPI